MASLKFKSSIFFFIVLLISVFSPTVVFAESLSSVPSPDLSVSVIPTPLIVDYQLPYPGLLPDNAFYFLKVMRDRIEAFLISKPLSRASFDLLQSDKRIAGAFMLLNERSGKVDLAVATFSKGENYFGEGIVNILDAKKQGMDVRDLERQYVSSQVKHREILQAMAQKVTRNDRKKIVSLLSRLDNFEVELKKWKHEMSR